MSQLKARCIDQVLTFENTPVITSGDVNYDSIMFDFCSRWDGFTKTAVFYRSEDEVYYQLLDEANTCNIPNEVLTDKGDIYIGVFGTSGDTTLTSQVLKYKITRGAITENLKPSDPTPDIYAQILSRYNAIIEELARQFQKLEDLQAEYTGAVGNADTLNGHKSDYFFPKSGGTINGNVEVKSTTHEARKVAVENSKRRITLEVDSNGVAYLWDGTNKKAIASFYLDGSNTWQGTASGNLPLTGGTVKTANRRAMSVSNTGGADVSIGYRHGDTLLGEIGVDSNGAYFIDSSGAVKRLLHNGNMASHVLPLTGGRIKSNSTLPLELQTLGSEDTLVLRLYNKNDAELGTIGFVGGLPVLRIGTGSWRDILHTGNMASHVLPITGGEIKSPSDVALTIGSTHTNKRVMVKYLNGSTNYGYLGFTEANKPVYASNTGTLHDLHHSGNSAKVHIGTSAPSDTSALWIDTTA